MEPKTMAQDYELGTKYLTSYSLTEDNLKDIKSIYLGFEEIHITFKDNSVGVIYSGSVEIKAK